MAKQPGLLVGAGTVLNTDTAKRAVDAGAQFIVSPGFNPKTVRWCVDHGVPITPGCSSPTDLEMALDHGVTLVKFFPAEALGGASVLKAYASPLADVMFCPTGGITVAKAREYLALPNVICVGGSWVMPADAVAARDFGRIEALAREAAALGA
jgi:2-dehydro-3-deoxyphosphogluconate aldolase/(4S)-4-hydroxy-2-oxoglutarate aldolase